MKKSLQLNDAEFDFYASLVEDPGIYRFISKQKIKKVNTEQRNVFGWASVGILPDGKVVVDHQGDVLDNPDEIEKAAYRFSMNSRDTGTMHVGSGGKGMMIESFVSTVEKTRAMGIPDGILPVGWWTGFHVTDDEMWEGIKDGKYKMFSVQGVGKREVIP